MNMIKIVKTVSGQMFNKLLKMNKTGPAGSMMAKALDPTRPTPWFELEDKGLWGGYLSWRDHLKK